MSTARIEMQAPASTRGMFRFLLSDVEGAREGQRLTAVLVACAIDAAGRVELRPDPHGEVMAREELRNYAKRHGYERVIE
jgi:hypothetical protein